MFYHRVLILINMASKITITLSIQLKALILLYGSGIVLFQLFKLILDQMDAYHRGTTYLISSFQLTIVESPT